MSKNKKKYLTDDEGNQYYILNNEKIYVKENNGFEILYPPMFLETAESIDKELKIL